MQTVSCLQEDERLRMRGADPACIGSWPAKDHRTPTTQQVANVGQERPLTLCASPEAAVESARQHVQADNMVRALC